ncbi:MAG: hypothetical protein LBC63_00400 [Holophagales bacterium]|nr:hypothetical protein [Holophagales bacterium]
MPPDTTQTEKSLLASMLDMRYQVFNIRLKVTFNDQLCRSRATNIVLAALCDGIEKNIFPLWAGLRNGDEVEISVVDLEIFP